MVFLFLSSAASATELATLTGYVTDPSGLRIPNTRVQITNLGTNISYLSETNDAGLYRISALPTGDYRVIVQKTGFKTIVKQSVELHVQDVVALNFQMEVGSVAESITVEGGTPLINTESAAVSTVIDRNFAENLPMNGRSFQTLIQLTPGVVAIPSNAADGGQFSINGQRGSSNYWMVDGVSANVGMGVTTSGSGTGNGLGGVLGSFSALGGTNSLVSVDAMQEFRIQTSSYAPEFGRTPGGQISIVTRSGTNQFHGTVFDYFRNDILDANNWFNGYTNSPPLPKARERQNDFGGTYSGPIIKDRTFFFFSYEGLRLRLPQTALSTVPDLNARKNASSVIQPYLNAFPLPNGADNLAAGIAQYNASFSNPATLDAYSIRADQRLGDRINIFGRYNYSPSEIAQRGNSGGASTITNSLNTISHTKMITQTATAGATWNGSSSVAGDIRANYSKTDAHLFTDLDSLGGAVPLTSLPLPSPYDSHNAAFLLDILSLQGGILSDGERGHNFQQQINVVGSTSIQRKSHAVKLGADFRRMTPQFEGLGQYQLFPLILDVPSAERASFFSGAVGSVVSPSPTFLFRNIGVYAQDTWRFMPRLTLTYGLRWDIDFAPTSTPALPAAIGFNVNDLSQLALAPAGTQVYATTYGNVAPRVGIAYQLSDKGDWQTVLRGGFGVFYDLATSELGNQIGAFFYPFGSTKALTAGTFPLSPAQLAPAPIAAPTKANNGTLFAIDPNLKLPYTLEWNVATEQGFGKQQTLTLSYVGAAGRRLLQEVSISSPNASLANAQLGANASTSDYDALQVQFRRRLLQRLQAMASYTWSHSIDTASAGSNFGSANALLPAALSQDRGPSDFDLRHTLSAALTYDLPATNRRALNRAVLGGWSTENIVELRSASPVSVSDSKFSTLATEYRTLVRPDLVPGQPLYLYGSQYPGGKSFNPSAFTDPPSNPTTRQPLRQGNTPRNFLRGFGAAQWDFAIHRDFPIHESLRLQFRAEMFNVLNHPIFGPPRSAFGSGGFGLATQTLSQSLSGSNLGGGGFSPLYQMGGPRSTQLALKLAF